MTDPYSVEELKKLDIKKLNEVKGILEKVINEIKTENKAKAINEVQKLLDQMGLSLADVGFNKRKTGATKKPVAPKYQNPSSPEQTWSGRGRRPDWFTKALDAGKTKKSLEIPTEATTRA